MVNKVYYGEYTLKHWIKLMLSEGVVLPQNDMSYGLRSCYG